jgi:hypothetical protein
LPGSSDALRHGHARDSGGEGERLCYLQRCARRLSNLYRIAHSIGQRRAVDILPAIVMMIVMVIVMVVAMSRGHVEIPMPVALADVSDLNSDVSDLNSDVLRDDYWFVASAQRAGECRHREERDNKKGD